MRAGIVVGVTVVSLAAAAWAGDPPAVKMPWDGFGADSYVQYKATTKVTMPGQAMPEQVTETKETLVKVTDEAFTVRYETKAPTGWTKTAEIQIPRKISKLPMPTGDEPKAATEDLGTEKVTVEGKEIECKKVRVKVAGASTTTTWTSETHGVLKFETEYEIGGVKTSSSRVVTALAKKVTIAGKEISCRESKTVMKSSAPAGTPAGMGGSETTMVELESDAVPGHKVREETSSATGPMTNVSVREVVAFEAKPL